MKEILTIREALLKNDDFLNRLGGLILSSIKYVCEGQALADLEACEKTYIGTRVQKQVQKTFGYSCSNLLDLVIEGIDVDIKFTLAKTWMIPPECIDHYCILISANETARTFSVGIFHAAKENLTEGANRDAKVSVSAAGKRTIDWLCKDRLMHVNDDVARAPTVPPSTNDLFIWSTSNG